MSVLAGLFLSTTGLCIGVIQDMAKDYHEVTVLFHQVKCNQEHRLPLDVINDLSSNRIKEYTLKTCKYDKFDWSEE